MKHSRIAMLAALAFFVVTGGYSLWTGRTLYVAVATLNAVVAVLVFRRLKDAPRAV